jgi:hypothetical protein
LKDPQRNPVTGAKRAVCLDGVRRLMARLTKQDQAELRARRRGWCKLCDENEH